MTYTHLHWWLQDRWHQGRLRLWAGLAAATLGAVACLAAGAALLNAHGKEAATQSELASRRAVALPSATAMAETRDFTAKLRASHSPDGIVEVIQSAAARAGVTLASVQVQEHVGAPDRLGRIELPMTLQGPYPAIKRCITETLDRLSSATVARLQWQRLEGTAETEARVQLVVWSAPAMAVPVSADKR
jgi:hypothetical protein